MPERIVIVEDEERRAGRAEAEGLDSRACIREALAAGVPERREATAVARVRVSSRDWIPATLTSRSSSTVVPAEAQPDEYSLTLQPDVKQLSVKSL